MYAGLSLKVVVMFVNEDNCRQLINATIVNHKTDVFYWLASDSWGAKRVPVDKQEWAAEGTVTIMPQRQVVHSKSLIALSFSHLLVCFSKSGKFHFHHYTVQTYCRSSPYAYHH